MEGQWVWRDGRRIAVIHPSSPVEILLSDDGGDTWRTSVVAGSDRWDAFGQVWEGAVYRGGYIGFSGPENGYLVLTGGVSMNRQDLRIYLTDDGGNTWREIGDPYGDHVSVLTGAGFSSDQVGFVCYRYFEDRGPDIWWTRDGGGTWERLTLDLPEAYRGSFLTPLSPVFRGEEGILPIRASGDTVSTIYFYTHDGGLTWSLTP